MKGKRSDLVLGTALILLGGFFLAVYTGIVPELSGNMWAIVFAGAGLLFFVGYLVSGLRNWGLLFPAVGGGAIGLTIWLAEAGTAGSIVGGLFMLLISVPFWAAFLVDRRNNWWALIPGWAVVVIGLVAALSEAVAGELLGALMMLGIGLPFFVVYLRNRQNWWALIPAGVLTSVSATAALAGLELTEAMAARLLGGVLFAGLATTFAVLWLLRGQHDTDWAKYPAAGLGIMALLLIFFGVQTELVWPVVLIAIGLWLLYSSARRPGMKH